MLGWLRDKAGFARPSHRIGRDLYERIVAQARRPPLYQSCGVPDTMDGRLELILLHVVMVLERLKAEGPEGQRIGQRLMEALVADLDDALRQIGLGDDAVAHRMPRLAGALRERARDYGFAFDEVGAAEKAPRISAASAGEEIPVKAAARKPDALETALLEHVYQPSDAIASAVAIPGVMRLAGYVRACRRTLAATPRAEVLEGFPAFADPE